MSTRIEDVCDSDVERMYYEEGWTQQEIADYYGVGQTTIYYRLHPEKMKEHCYRNNQTESTKESKKRYFKTDKGKAAVKRYQHSDKGKAWWKNWRLSDKGKKYRRKVYADRKGLGSIELNIPFPNSEGHHIDEEHIIHIPKELHQSIKHNVRSGEGMDVINDISFGYITEEMFDKLIAGEV